MKSGKKAKKQDIDHDEYEINIYDDSALNDSMPNNSPADDPAFDEPGKGDYSYSSYVSTEAIRTKKAMSLLVKIVSLVIVVAFAAALTIQINNCVSAVKRKNDLNNQISTSTDDLQNNMAALGEQYSADGIKKLFGTNQLPDMMNKYWSYQLLVNNVPVKDAIVPPPPGNITATLTQVPSHNTLPAVIVALGNPTQADQKDKLAHHLYFTDKSLNVQSNTTTDGNTTTVTYTVPDAKSGAVLDATLSPLLSNALGLSDLSFKIIVQ